ncbi:MAG TPA: prenyltransferase/squalene oxidase repeat-containing protein [Marmoricola sp.]|nr:prenyltransferase/squalene oxidase repeat-containing protein [Marmoricola sp.]
MRKHLDRTVRRHLHRAALGLTTAALLVGCGADDPTTTSGKADAPATSAEATAAASWLAGQLDDGLMHSSYEDPPGSGTWVTVADHGLSLDALFALREVEGYADERGAILDAIEPEADAYVGSGKNAYAGSTGKLLRAVQVEDDDPATYAGGDLVARLERLVRRKPDDELGRAKDRWDAADEFGGDYSNTIGQSWVVRALTGADSDLTDEAASFLLAQQCADGFFRLLMESEDHTCDGGTPEESKPSVDATAFAAQALLELQDAGVEVDVAPALDDAAAWLVAQQAGDGSFVDADSGAANANSTGVAAEALLLLGEEDAADQARAWLVDHQVTSDSAGEELAEQAGAVAFDDAALDKAQDKGITRAVRYQWQRATAQAVAGLAGGTSGGASGS